MVTNVDRFFSAISAASPCPPPKGRGNGGDRESEIESSTTGI